jgi:hypothetical protein
MGTLGELGRKGVPRALPAEKLQRTLGSSPVFCSWNVSNSKISDVTTGWPFLFSHPLLGTNKNPARQPLRKLGNPQIVGRSDIQSISKVT